MLEKIAEIMKIPVETIKNFNDESVVNIIVNSLHDNSCVNLHDSSCVLMHNPTFNAMDKVIELYEKLLAEKDKTIAVLDEISKKFLERNL